MYIAISPWYFQTAAIVRNCSNKIVNALLKPGDVTKHFIEWCDTPVVPAMGFAYADRAVRYDYEGKPCVVVPQPTQAMFFFFGCEVPLLYETCRQQATLPVGLGDPVLEDCMAELNVALSQTFWCNWRGLEACRAALALAKRGINVNQMFILWALGGCGLSLFSDLIATSLGDDLHEYFDPYILYDDEELRKCVDCLSGALVLTAQERPQGGKKKLLLHLYKKLCSAEGLRARLPYAVITRMLRLIGWKKMEVNSIIEFADVTEGEFESIIRRACIFKIYSRFFDKDYLSAHFPNHERYGVFARKPHLQQAFRSLPYAAAWNTSQHAFEELHGRDECEKMIVEFSRNGGDLGVTERFLRTGCRLEARPDNSNFSFTEGIVAGVNIDVSLECMSIPKSMSVSVNIRKFAVSLMVEACDRELDYMTWTYYKQKGRNPIGMPLSREELWAKLDESAGWSTAPKKGKRIDAKFPLFKLKVNHDTMFGSADLFPIVLPEVYDVIRASHVVRDLRIFRENLAICIEVLSSIIEESAPNGEQVAPDSSECAADTMDVDTQGERPRKRIRTKSPSDPQSPVAVKGRVRGRGRGARGTDSTGPPIQINLQPCQPPPKKGRGRRHNGGAENASCPMQAGEVDVLEKALRKLKSIRSTLSSLLGPGVASSGAQLKNIEASVQYTPCRSWISREIARTAEACQHWPQLIQEILCPATSDIDIKNCSITLVSELIPMLGLEPDVLAAFKDEISLLNDLRHNRDTISREVFKLSRRSGKDVINMSIAGRNFGQLTANDSAECKDTLRRLRRLSRFLRWLGVSFLGKEKFAVLAEDPATKWPESSAFAHMWQSCEAHCLRTALGVVLEKPCPHISLAYDGFRVANSRIEAEVHDEASSLTSTQVLMNRCTEAIKGSELPFNVTFCHKTHMTLEDSIAKRSQATIWPPGGTADRVWSDGYGVCAALLFLYLGEDEAAEHIRAKINQLPYYSKTGMSYAQLIDQFLLKGLEPQFNVAGLVDGDYLVHSNGKGTPRCFGVHATGGVLKISMANRAWECGVLDWADLVRTTNRNHCTNARAIRRYASPLTCI